MFYLCFGVLNLDFCNADYEVLSVAEGGGYDVYLVSVLSKVHAFAVIQPGNRFYFFAQGEIVVIILFLAAKECPEKYPDVIVRVCGFSAPFICLSEQYQDEIISRNISGV